MKLQGLILDLDGTLLNRINSVPHKMLQKLNQ